MCYTIEKKGENSALGRQLTSTKLKMFVLDFTENYVFEALGGC